MTRYENNYEVPAKSRQELRSIAKQFRKILGINTPYFPVPQVFEVLELVGIHGDVVDDDTWNKYYGCDKYAEYDLKEKTISIRESVYDAAIAGSGRDRFTMAHEIAHALLLDNHNVKVCRSTDLSPTKTYCNPEWQADCLAGELLVPYDKCKDMSEQEIVEKCKVSYDAAKYQKSKF